MATQLDLADAQFIGFRMGKHNSDGVLDLVKEMGLTKKEWGEWKDRYPNVLDEIDFWAVDGFFKKENYAITWKQIDRAEQLRTNVGEVGLFFNDGDEKTHKIGRLKSVTPNGNCEDEDGCYYDNFNPMGKSDLLELIDLEFFS
jgi:hypothetical protein